jgi:hypothetical protein
MQMRPCGVFQHLIKPMSDADFDFFCTPLPFLGASSVLKRLTDWS